MPLPKRLLAPVVVAALAAGCDSPPPPKPAASTETPQTSSPPTVTRGKAAGTQRKPKERLQPGPRIPSTRKDL